MKTMRAYLAIKFHKDNRNRELIESISDSLQTMGFETVVMARDFERWGEIVVRPAKLMKKTFEEIEKRDVLIVEYSEKGVGLGIEAGYGYPKKIPVVVIAKTDSEISETIKGIMKCVIFYDDPSEIRKSTILQNWPVNDALKEG